MDGWKEVEVEIVNLEDHGPFFPNVKWVQRGKKYVQIEERERGVRKESRYCRKAEEEKGSGEYRV